MAQGAANLVDHVLPPHVPLRQFVLTVPFELRARLGYDGKLCGAVCRIFVDSVLGFYQRRMRDLDPSQERGKSGAVTVVQRLNMDLRLNPHFHSICLDGVFVATGDGALRFCPLPRLSSTDVAELLQVVRVRILRFLERRGVIEGASEELTVLPHDLTEREPALAELAAASVSGLMPAGPERRARPPITLSAGGALAITAPLTATELGFSLNAATTVDGDEEAGREALCRYVLRPPIAHEHLEHLSDELVRIHLRHPFADGTTAVDLDPLSLLVRLATSVPPPLFNTIRYGGVLAPAARWRSLVVPPPSEPAEPPAGGDDTSRASKPPTHRSGWRPWQELMRRSFSVDVEACSHCNGRMKLIALVTRPESIHRLLRHLGEPTEVPPRAPARDPPFFKSATVRRRLGHGPPSAQLDMFTC